MLVELRVDKKERIAVHFVCTATFPSPPLSPYLPCIRATGGAKGGQFVQPCGLRLLLRRVFS